MSKRPKPEPKTDLQRRILQHNDMTDRGLAKFLGCSLFAVQSNRKKFRHIIRPKTGPARNSKKIILDLVRARLAQID